MQRFYNRPAMTAYIISAAIFTVLLYLLLFEINNNARTFCEQRNEQLVFADQRARDIDTIAETMSDYMVDRLGGDRTKIAEGTPAIRRVIVRLDEIQTLPIDGVECDATFPRPWPF